MIFNLLLRSTILLVVLLEPILAQSLVFKPHAEQLQNYGQLHPDQNAGFNSTPRVLEPRNTLRDPSHVVFGYHPYWNGTAWQNYNYELLSHVAWFGLGMNASGDITTTNGWPVTGLVDLAHSHGVKVIVTVTLFDNDGINSLLASATARQTAIDNLISRVNQGSADGVNIDFEFVPTAARSNFNLFIHDLTVAFHDQIPGSEVSIAMPSVDWWGSYDYNYLSDNCDGLMIMAYGYYYGGSSNAGPLSPLNSGLSSWYIRRTIEDYLTKTGDDASQLILGLPWYGYNWPVVSTAMGAATTGTGSSITYTNAEPSALTYGKQYNSTAPSAWYNYSSGGPRQVWYDDSLSLATKYNYIKDMDLKGLGIWALGYDGNRPEIWGGLSDAFGASAPPLAPQYFTVRNVGDGAITVQCAPSMFADSYLVLLSSDGESFTVADSSSSPTFQLSGLAEGQVSFVKVKARNIFGSSNATELLGVKLNSSEASNILIVQGFERTSGTVNTFDYIIEHGSAVAASGRGFDAASNDAVIAGTIDLSSYGVVDWISGEEATATVSFSSAEQSRISEYLEMGGRLFVSGSEIGWDLEASGSTSDISFYHDYFKADYIADDANSYVAVGNSNGIFNGLNAIDFDDGSHGSYNVDYPDGIKPYGGSLSNLHYGGVDYESVGGAGIQYLGSFGSSTAAGGIVYLAVGFETIYPESQRNAIMDRVLNFLETVVDVDPEPQIPSSFAVSSIYPNPFNGSFSLEVTSPAAQRMELRLFNLKGQLLLERSHQVQVGTTRLTISLEGLPHLGSGSYILQVEGRGETRTQRLTYIK